MQLAKNKLGKYIETVDIKNTDGIYNEDDVRGISTQKIFIDTKANLSGVSLSNYKLVPPNTFAYVPDTSRRGDKISLAYNQSNDTYIVSSISVVFRVMDDKQNDLAPDYLFMLFNRPEFDRYSRYNSFGSAREPFDWSDMCDIDIELPPIEIQQKFVDIYNGMVTNQQTKDKTHSAIMLTGGWGTGKSYFIEHSLKTYLEEKDMECIVISLYGLKALTEISKAIYLEARLKKLKSNSEAVKAGKIVAKTLIKGAAGFFNIDLSQNDSDWDELYSSIDLTNKLIILEDVERTSIDIIELLGYINNFVEQDNVKILLVANEEELTNEIIRIEDENDKGSVSVTYDETDDNLFAYKYYKVKEKTVSDTVIFECDLKESLKNILNSFENEIIKTFNNDSFIDEIIAIGSDKEFNLRSFLFACQKTNDIFEKLPDDTEYINLKCIFLSVINFSMDMKSGESINWNGNQYYSIEQGVREYPLFRFCYDFIVNSKMALEFVEECFNEYSKLRLLDERKSINDEDVLVVCHYYTYEESVVLTALENLKHKLKDPMNISFYEYYKIVNRLVELEDVLGINSEEYKTLMISNLTQYKKDLNVRSLFFSGADFITDDMPETKKEKYLSFIDDLSNCLDCGNETILCNFDYDVEKINELYNYVCIHDSEIKYEKSSFADWLNNQNVRNELKLEIKICLVKNGYPPQYSPEVFNKVMEQVENFEENA